MYVYSSDSFETAFQRFLNGSKTETDYELLQPVEVQVDVEEEMSQNTLVTDE